ncbi:permease [Hyphomicrobium sp.]|jgi:ABC-2 type transport system permease protein|uniref:permease n=1 Tax=Hyphomicrobium sp. TaxID=82 RepID=UPI00356AD4D8
MTTASLPWFARHELKLAWRDWAQMAAGGRTKRERSVLIGAVIFVALLHWLAYVLLSRVLPGADLASKATLITLTASILLTFSMMLSQAIEQVTRAFYARSDLDLILSSPASSRNLFAVRIASIALTGAAMSAMMIAPAINAAAWIDGPRWLSAYAVIAGLSAFATGLAVLITLGLFRVAGAKRTRLIAQIIAAVVGAALLIGLQAAAVFAYGRLSRFSILNSEAVGRAAPALDSLFWMPAKALIGDASAAVAIVTTGIAFLALVIAVYASEFGSNAIVAASVETDKKSVGGISRPFRKVTPIGALRHKELTLLGRDPWLLSQTLMQILYLLPPALLLWRDMGQDTQVHVILAPVLVMAFGQLSGGLSWLTISGEDAPDLMATAPATGNMITRAKIEAVLTVIACAAAPFVIGIAFISKAGAVATLFGIVAASISAITIQLWFKSTAKRNQFRRRQTATKVATFSEAFSSIFWAGATGFAAASSWFALAFIGLALLTLWLTSRIKPEN